MAIKKALVRVITACMINLIVLGNVHAIGISVTCEYGVKRSKIVVTGVGLNTGESYFAQAYASGSGWSKPSAVKTGSSLTFVFDTNSGGATYIPANFIKDGRVLGNIRRNRDKHIEAQAVATCKKI